MTAFAFLPCGEVIFGEVWLSTDKAVSEVVVVDGDPMTLDLR